MSVRRDAQQEAARLRAGGSSVLCRHVSWTDEVEDWVTSPQIRYDFRLSEITQGLCPCEPPIWQCATGGR